MATERKKILYYDLKLFSRSSKGQRTEIDAVADALKHIRTLPATSPPTPASRYMDYNGDILLMEIFHVGTEIQGAYAVKRSSNLPRVERGGAWSDIQLQAGAGLADIRHFVFWPKRKLLGLEVNGRGAGISGFGDYLKEKAGKQLGFVHVEPTIYLSLKQFDTLYASQRISTATIGVKRSSISELTALDPLVANSFRELAKSNNAQELRMELILGDRRQNASLSVPWLKGLRAFVKSSKHRAALTTLKATARDPALNESRTIDLLEDRFVGYEDVVHAPNGVVDQTDMLRAIRKHEKNVK